MAIYGEYNFEILQNGAKCECLGSRIQSSNDYSCEACRHGLSYHAEISSKNFNGKLNRQIMRRNNHKNKIYCHPYKRQRPINFKLICIVGGKSNQKIPRK